MNKKIVALIAEMKVRKHLKKKKDLLTNSFCSRE